MTGVQTCALPISAQPWKHALALADRALYAAKAAQRNAVWCALPGAMPQADALHRPASELLSQGHVTLLPARS